MMKRDQTSRASKSMQKKDVNTAPDPETNNSESIAFVVVLVAAFMDLLDATIVSVAAPAISASLNASETALQWTVAGYTLAVGTGLITGGRIGDQYGRRRAFLIGLTLFTLASGGCALAPNPTVLIAVRIGQGLAGGLMIPQVFGIIRSSFGPVQRAKALGAYGGVLALASVAGPLLGGLLVSTNLFGLGWRNIFLVNVPVGVIGVLLGAKALPKSQETSKTRLDLAGAALVAISTVLIILPLTQGREWGWPWWSFTLMVLALPLIVLFILRERRLASRGDQPILNPSLLHVKAFVGGVSASLLFFGSIGPFFLLLSLYLQLGTGRTALEAGLIILPYAIGSVLTSGVGVQLASRAGRALLITGSLILAASQFILLLIIHSSVNPSYWVLAMPLLLGGLGLGLTAPALINVVLTGVPGKDASAAGAVLTTAGQIGNAAGIAILGAVFFAALGNSFAMGAAPRLAYANALTSILPWQCVCYVVAACLMLLLPARAVDHDS